MTSNNGVLQIVFEGPFLDSEKSFRLEFGDRITIGRGQGCDLSIDEETLSREHIECLWDGTKLKIRDLKSTNGLFVVTHNSKKRSSSIDGVGENGSFVLFLGNLELKVSWKALSEILFLDKTEIAESKTKPGESVVEESLEATPEPISTAEESKNKVIPSQKDSSAMASSVSNAGDFPENSGQEQQSILAEKPGKKWNYVPALLFLLISILIFYTARFFWSSQLGAFSELSYVLLQQGAEWDLVYIWLKNIQVSLLTALLVAGIGSYVFAKVIFRSRKVLGVLLFPFIFCVFLFLPFLKLPKFVNVQSVQKMHALLSELPPKESLQERKDFLQKRAKEFTGSSYYYKEYFLSHVKLIFDACQTKRIALSWEKKKLCLIMLQSVSIESFEEIQPVLYEKLIPDMVSVLSLDALLRIVSAEGVESVGVQVLVKNLDRIGFGEQSKAWLDSFQSESEDFEESIDALLEERKKFENRFDETFARLKIDPDFVFKIPNPLDAGI